MHDPRPPLRMPFAALLALAGTLTLATVAIAAAAADDVVEARPAVQAEIDRAAQASHSGPTGSPTGDSDLDRLMASVDGDRNALLIQIAIYLSRSPGTRQSMGAALLVARLEIDDGEMLATVIPNLDTRDNRLRAVLYDWLGSVDRTEGAVADFSIYAPLLKAGSYPASLVRYLYETDPVRALELFASIEKAKSDRMRALRGRVEQVESSLVLPPAGPDPLLQAAVGELAADGSWWVRLYATEVIRRRPAAADDAARQRLEADTDPLVSLAARGWPPA